MDVKDDTRKRSLLLYCAGPAVDKIFDSIPENSKDEDYDVAIKKLPDCFAPKKNRLCELHIFRQAKQRPGETIDQFHTRLCNLAQTCEFIDAGFKIKIQLMQHCSCSRVRGKALCENFSLDELIKYGRTLQLSSQQVQAVKHKNARIRFASLGIITVDADLLHLNANIVVVHILTKVGVNRAQHLIKFVAFVASRFIFKGYAN